MTIKGYGRLCEESHCMILTTVVFHLAANMLYVIGFTYGFLNYCYFRNFSLVYV